MSAKPNQKKNVCGMKIRFLRYELGEKNQKDFSQNDLAAALQLKGLSVCKNTIQEIESGKRSIRDYELKAIADFFGVTVDTLFDEV